MLALARVGSKMSSVLDDVTSFLKPAAIISLLLGICF